MRVIWKFPIRMQSDAFIVSLPENASILHVEEQGGVGTFWALVDPDANREKAVFRIYGTGQEIPDDCRYIGTFTQLRAALVWHLFRVLTDEV